MALIVKDGESKGILAGMDGRGRAEVGETHVYFNGKSEKLACEPFKFPGDTMAQAATGEDAGFNICKTNWNPYDTWVVACLLVATDHIPRSALEVSSDGEREEWEEGAQVYRNVLARNPTPALDKIFDEEADEDL